MNNNPILELTYKNPQNLYERAVTSCESKIIDLEYRQTINEKKRRERAIELQKYLLNAVHFYNSYSFLEHSAVIQKSGKSITELEKAFLQMIMNQGRGPTMNESA